ncbi:recombinase family protein [Brevibacillus parabrevis]|uniref:recombinase family protein n=1 Tax=Brevibacillus parabrevis TaxID=54914 RepID=UPI001F6226D5|nr:recombinase family protein [Brevibacillus parabrevis]
MKELRAAIYVRVSTEEQVNEGFSIQAQLADLHRYAEVHNMEVVEQYVDEGYSGKSIEGRPHMQRLLQDSRQGNFNVVLVYKIDRLARKLKDALEINDELEKNGVQLVSINENIDTTTPMGRMVFQMVGSIAEMERNTIVGRVKMGMTERAKQGKFNGGICLGYHSVNKTLVVNDEEAPLIREIFNLAEQGLGYKAIVGHLNVKGYKTKKGNAFSVIAVKDILSNPMYIGKVRFNQKENWSEKRRKGRNKEYLVVEGEHEAIISEDQWERVQSLRNKRSYKPSRSEKPFVLSGLLKCPMCGYGMVPGYSQGSEGTRYRYYVCGQHHNKGKTVCKANSIRADIAEQEVMSHLSFLVSDPVTLKMIVNQVNAQRANAEKPFYQEQKLVESKLKQIDKNTNKLLEALLDESMPKNIISKKLNELEEEKTQLESRFRQLQTELSDADTKPIDYEALRILLSDFQMVLSNVVPEQQKALLRLVIKDITVSKEAPRGIGRRIEKINLRFDFTIDAMENTYELLKQLYPNVEEQLQPWKKRKSRYNINVGELFNSLPILPLTMIRFPPTNPKRPINLLQQHQPHQLMRKRHL